MRISTAAKVVKTTAKIGVSAVKGTVKGISWSVKKANGKINENRLMVLESCRRLQWKL